MIKINYYSIYRHFIFKHLSYIYIYIKFMWYLFLIIDIQLPPLLVKIHYCLFVNFMGSNYMTWYIFFGSWIIDLSLNPNAYKNINWYFELMIKINYYSIYKHFIFKHLLYIYKVYVVSIFDNWHSTTSSLGEDLLLRICLDTAYC